MEKPELIGRDGNIPDEFEYDIDQDKRNRHHKRSCDNFPEMRALNAVYHFPAHTDTTYKKTAY